MKLVAVSQRVDRHPDRNEQRDALDQRLCAWILEAGYLPVPVPNGLTRAATRQVSVLATWLDQIKPDAVILSGGNDIGEMADRDETEQQLLTYARDRFIPLLGICHGMQMMGAWAGVTLRASPGHTRTRHNLHGEFKEDVNSYHNYSLAQMPQGYRVTAASDDECIEAIRHESLPWEGWMWHPEREPEFLPLHIQRLRKLFGE